MRIEVTAEDLVNGKIGRCRGCPIALAVNRVLGEGHYASVMRHFVVVRNAETEDVEGDFCLPTEASLFVAKFDGGMDVKPFMFHLELDEDLLIGPSE